MDAKTVAAIRLPRQQAHTIRTTYDIVPSKTPLITRAYRGDEFMETSIPDLNGCATHIETVGRSLGQAWDDEPVVTYMVGVCRPGLELVNEDDALARPRQQRQYFVLEEPLQLYLTLLVDGFAHLTLPTEHLHHPDDAERYSGVNERIVSLTQSVEDLLSVTSSTRSSL